MRSGQKGTTLFELTTTAGVLCVVTAMALPAFSAFTQQARVSRAIGEISAISVQLHQWRVRNGNGHFPASLAAAGIALDRDPWGNAYAYLRLEDAARDDMRRDDRRQPLNSDFDLYSPGPDGQSAAALDADAALDDIVRARDGAFIGRASTY